MEIKRTVLVTGCNKGVGYGIVQVLASEDKWNIIMAVRNLELGQKARVQILQKYPNSQLHLERLDISSSASIDQFISVAKEKYKSIDILINNAGIGKTDDSFNSKVLSLLLATNFYGTIQLTQKLKPLLSNKGKIIFLGSFLGKKSFHQLQNEQLKGRFQNEKITKQQLVELFNQYQASVADNTFIQKGWTNWDYGLSKLGITIYSQIISRSQEILSRGIQVYSCCPGTVVTDMVGPFLQFFKKKYKEKTFVGWKEGAATPKYLIDLPWEINSQLQGKFFQFCKISPLFEPITQ